MAVLSDDMGGITAYAAAVNRGYTGTKEEFEQLMYSYTEVAERAEAAAGNAHESEEATIEAKDIAVSAKNEAVSARDASQSARDASVSAKNDSESARVAAISAKNDTLAAKDAVMSAKGSVDETSANFSEEVTAAISDVNAAGRNQKELAKTHAIDSEAWAVGQREGADVGVSDTTYHNNSKYYAEQSALAKSETETARDTAITAKNDAVSAKNEAETAKGDAQDIVDGINAKSEQIDQNTSDISELKEDLSTKAFDIGSYNRFDSSEAIDGVITKTGAIVANQDCVISDYMPVTAGEILYAKHYSAVNYALFDEDLNIVSNDTNWSNPFTVPNGVYFIRMTIEKPYKDNAYVSTKNGFDAFEKITPYMHTRFGAIDNSYDAYRDGNLIDISNLTSNVYVNGAVDGSLKAANGFYATDYIPVIAGKQYYSNQNYVFRGYAAFYNANYEYISGYGNGAGLFWSNPITVPTNAAYARFTILEANVQNAWLSEVNRMATKPENYSKVLNVRNQYISSNPAEYNGNEISVFSKILCVGDSLTDGFFNEDNGTRLIIRKYSYPAQLQKLSGVECTNMGHAGYASGQWYEAYQNEDLSGHDACIIQLGVNDQLQNVSESDMNTALSNIITKVKNENTGIKIFVATIIPANGYMTTAMRTRSQMIRDFVSALNDPNVYLVDMWTYGHTDDYLAYDASHLSALGYLRLAEDYKAYISSIIKNNINDFRYVQFIGTSYTYNGTAYVREITY